MKLDYWHWLAIVSALFLVLERLFPWRKQELFRPGWLRDLVFLVFNAHLFGAVLTAWVLTQVADSANAIFQSAGVDLETISFAANWPFWAQVAAFLLITDFVQWCTHVCLHKFPFLWRFHKVHHSIPDLDWIANFHFHWFEILVYKTTQYVPIMLLGASNDAMLTVFVLSTAWGHMNHANINISLGPLGYVFNNPRMHLWHHDDSAEGGTAKNFAIVFSLWDNMFRTAFWPRDRNPARLGYPGDEEMPQDLRGQLFWPLAGRSNRATKAPPDRP